MPRKPAAMRDSTSSVALEPILRKALAPMPSNTAVGRSRSDAGGGGALPAHSKARRGAFLSALMRRRPRVNVLAVLCEQVVYHVMWLVESVVLVGRLCCFLMRFGFKQL
ncbi:hypothetical protein D1007_50859 [Hordeum vulgare]|nr:hypothetical protein D1007_50859 [Hordeum vulgare]